MPVTHMFAIALSMPGWPAAEPPGALLLFGLMVGIPVALGGIIALIAAGPWLVRRSRGGDIREGADPLWLGSAADEDPKALAADAADDMSQVENAPATTGGTSVRW